MLAVGALPIVAVGVDVGERRIHAVRVSVRASGGRPEVTGAYRGPLSAQLLGLCQGARRVAVDAPGGPSCGAHRDDEAVAPKFRAGRCSEVPIPGLPAVPWVTPAHPSQAAGWMRTGFDVWDLLVASGLDVVETFPAASFYVLNGRRWPPPKSTVAGRAARLGLLSRLVDLPADAAGSWTHDDLDAAVAALVAATGSPVEHRCSRPDGSVMWVPDPWAQDPLPSLLP